MNELGPRVGIIMGSQSDWQTMQHAAATLDRLGIGHEARIVPRLTRTLIGFTITPARRARGACG